jgi:hypothetical protein
MAVGPTESLHQNVFQMTQFQVQISNQAAALVQGVMRGVKTSTINPDTAIPPANAARGLRSEGIGSQLDLEA